MTNFHPPLTTSRADDINVEDGGENYAEFTRT